MWKKISCLFIMAFMVFVSFSYSINAGNEITNEPYDTKIDEVQGKQCFPGYSLHSFIFYDIIVIVYSMPNCKIKLI